MHRSPNDTFGVLDDSDDKTLDDLAIEAEQVALEALGEDDKVLMRFSTTRVTIT